MGRIDSGAEQRVFILNSSNIWGGGVGLVYALFSVFFIMKYTMSSRKGQSLDFEVQYVFSYCFFFFFSILSGNFGDKKQDTRQSK